ncbi:MAG TPA: DUF998 domain-containing protein [Candidatus Acidoferrum sp.]|nr:DUF998 domain-containing protein [Candidatus Acidoferrum sp.]
MVVQEVDATGDCRIPQRISAEVKAGNCACEVRNPQGSCCLGNVTAVVKRLKADRISSEATPAVVSDQTFQHKTVAKLRLLSLIAILGAGIFAVAEVVQPFYRSDRTLSDPYSSYAVGQYGFVQTIAFLALSAGSFALSFGLSRIGGSTVGLRLGRTLLAVWAFGVLVAAVFPIENGALPASSEIHGLASMLSFLAIITAMFVLSMAFERQVDWRSFARHSWVLAIVAGSSFLLGVVIHHSLCFAVLQRMFLGAVVLWICATSARLRGLAPG